MKFQKGMDITGKKFNRLLAISPTEVRTPKGLLWKCLCDCGNFVEIAAYNLKSSNTKSCGCLMRETSSKLNKTHGLWTNNRKVYTAWMNIKKRCFNKNYKHFETYGAKGITLEERFVKDFAAFLEEVGQPPKNTREWSIDRINPNMGYETGNMRWVTQDVQARNFRKFKTNSSGKTGVLWSINTAGNTRAMAHWIDLDGKPRTKTFLVRKYGLLPAFKMAVEYRNTAISKLNDLGAGYTVYHGE